MSGDQYIINLFQIIIKRSSGLLVKTVMVSFHRGISSYSIATDVDIAVHTDPDRK
jgi:hypothetical protein